MTVTENIYTKQAFHLIRNFLKDHGLQNTLGMLETEVPEEELEELHGVILPHNKPLVAILEQYDLLFMQERMNQVALKSATKALENMGSVSRWEEIPSLFSEIHKANILTSIFTEIYLPTISTCGFPNATALTPVLLTGSTDKTIRMTHAETRDLLFTFDCFSAAILTLCSYPKDPRFVLASSMDGSHAVLDLVKKRVVQQWQDHAKYVNRALFSEDGEYLVTGSYDKSIRIYRRVERDPSRMMEDHEDTEVDDGVPFFETNGKVVTFSGVVESMAIVPPPSATTMDVLEEETLETAASSPRVVVGIREDNYLHYINLSSPSSHETYNMNANGDDWVSFTPMDICVSPDPSRSFLLVYTDSNAGRLLLLKTYSGIILKEYWGTKMDPLSQPRCAFDSGEHAGGTFFATSNDFSIHVISTATGELVQQLVGHDGVVRSLDVSKDGRFLVSSSYDKTVRIWKRQDL